MALTEQAWQEQVIDLARLYRWRVAHFRSARIARKDGSHYYATPVQADGEGFPDLVLVKAPRLIFAEVKTERGRLGDKQIEWLAELRDCMFDPAARFPLPEVYVWKPSDVDQVIETLSGGTHVQR